MTRADAARREQLLRSLYDAHGRHDIDGALALLTDDVAWPDVAGRRTIHGHDAVRGYWTEQLATIDPHVEPTAFATDDDTGDTVVTVHQVVRALDGTVLRDGVVTHTFTFRGDRVAAMQVGAP